jgi:S1-C subfamily serine protease
MSRRTARRALALVALAAAIQNPAWALSAEQVYAKVSGAVWRVRTYDADNLPLGQGSAVVIGDATLVTNCHVLRRAKRVAVKRESVTLEATLKLWDPQRDVCQLHAEKLVAPAVGLGEAGRVTVGHSVYAIGNPKGLDLTMSAGLVSSLRRNPAGQLVLIQTSAAISGGSSGGGLFDDAGRLIGLTTIGSVGADTQNLNFAVPVDWVRELPQRHAERVAAAASAPSGTVARPATVQAGNAESPSYRPAASAGPGQ